jgi:hypothetical protein
MRMPPGSRAWATTGAARLPRGRNGAYRANDGVLGVDLYLGQEE